MKVLVYPHSMQVGGIQINAIDLAGALRHRGHDVLVVGPPGPLVAHAAERGVRVVTVDPTGGSRPSTGAARILRRLVAGERFELVHAYGRVACLEAYFGAQVAAGVPLVTTMMGFFVPRPFPKAVPLIMGTAAMVERAARDGHRSVHLLEPWVDTDANHPSLDSSRFLREQDLEKGLHNVVIVSRLANRVKREGLQRSIEAVGRLAADLPVRLIVVGGGEAFDELQRRAEDVNHRIGRRAIILTGELLDPRAAYAAADVVVGMGSSVLRGMAFRKPAVVIGEQGFSEVVTPSTLETFLERGFYGRGQGDLDVAPLAGQLERLLVDAGRREELGAFARRLVCERFSLDTAARTVERIYAEVVGRGRATTLAEGLGIAAYVQLSRLKQRFTAPVTQTAEPAARGRGGSA